MFMSAPFRRIRLGKESRKGKRGGSSALFFTASTNYITCTIGFQRRNTAPSGSQASYRIYSSFINTMSKQVKGM